MGNLYRIWANRLEAGTLAWADCPAERQDGVDAVLLQDVKNGKLCQEKYDEIKGGLSSAEALNIILGGAE